MTDYRNTKTAAHMVAYGGACCDDTLDLPILTAKMDAVPIKQSAAYIFGNFKLEKVGKASSYRQTPISI